MGVGERESGARRALVERRLTEQAIARVRLQRATAGRRRQHALEHIQGHHGIGVRACQCRIQGAGPFSGQQRERTVRGGRGGDDGPRRGRAAGRHGRPRRRARHRDAAAGDRHGDRHGQRQPEPDVSAH